MMLRILLLLIALLFVGYAQENKSDEQKDKPERLKSVDIQKQKLKKRNNINRVVYDLMEQFVDYFQSDVNSMKSISFGKRYEFDEKTKLWKKAKKSKDAETEAMPDVGVEMLSGKSINIALGDVDMDNSFDPNTKLYLYHEFMGRNYKTRGGEKLNFIDIFMVNSKEVSYNYTKVNVKQKKIDESKIDEMRKLIYFDYYAQIQLRRVGVHVYFNVIIYDAVSKGVVLVMNYDKMVAMLGSVPFEWNTSYSMSFGIENTAYTPMEISMDFGKKLYGIGSVGLDTSIGLYHYNDKILGNQEMASILGVVNSPTAKAAEKQKAINKHAFSFFKFGPYFIININELARKRTSIFEFYFGTNFRVGYYAGTVTQYKPFFFDMDFFFKINIGHWFMFLLGVNTTIMYAKSNNASLTKYPYGPANFYLGMGLNIF